MPPARLARLTTLIAMLLAGAVVARADVGGTLSLQTDARDRGMSYSGGRPSAQLGLAWDGQGGWYAGAQLAYVRFDAGRRGAALQVYGGRVFELAPGLDGEVGLIAHAVENLSHDDFQEAYAGLLGEGWTLRFYLSPDYYGTGQRSAYAELNLRRPLAAGWALVAHAGLLDVSGGWALPYARQQRGSRRDVRVGLSHALGESGELQLAWVAASRGGPYTGTGSMRRRGVVLGLTLAF